MNSKGLFSLVLVLFFIVLSFKAFQMQKEFLAQTKEAAKFLLEMEKASFIRSELETNFDFLINHSVSFWAKESLDSKFLKEKTSQEIAKFVSNTENVYPQTIEFFLFKKSKLKKQDFSKKEMKNLFNIHVIFVKNLYEAEFSFNGGYEKNLLFGSQIELNNFSQNFFITPGYIRKVFGLAAG